MQHIERLSCASATWYEGTAQLLSLTELKSHLFELYFIGWTIKPMKEGRKPEYPEKTPGDELKKIRDNFLMFLPHACYSNVVCVTAVNRHKGRLVFLEYVGEGTIDQTLFLVGKVVKLHILWLNWCWFHWYVVILVVYSVGVSLFMSDLVGWEGVPSLHDTVLYLFHTWFICASCSLPVWENMCPVWEQTF